VIDHPIKGCQFKGDIKGKGSEMLGKNLMEKRNRLDTGAKFFSFPLHTVVEGRNLSGNSFKEETSLAYISHQGSCFSLKNQVDLGCRLKLVVDLPEKLAENKNLKLVLKGEVVFIEAGPSAYAPHQIYMKFDTKYVIQPDD
jgi:hypothetical protein